MVSWNESGHLAAAFALQKRKRGRTWSSTRITEAQHDSMLSLLGSGDVHDRPRPSLRSYSTPPAASCLTVCKLLRRSARLSSGPGEDHQSFLRRQCRLLDASHASGGGASSDRPSLPLETPALSLTTSRICALCAPRERLSFGTPEAGQPQQNSSPPL
jgi:hypothetical protein